MPKFFSVRNSELEISQQISNRVLLIINIRHLSTIHYSTSLVLVWFDCQLLRFCPDLRKTVSTTLLLRDNFADSIGSELSVLSKGSIWSWVYHHLPDIGMFLLPLDRMQANHVRTPDLNFVQNIMLIEGRPSDIWKVPTTPGLNCVSAQQEQNNLIAHQAIGIIVDFMLFALPIWVINSKMMKSAKKMQVIAVFSVGLFVVVTGIVRMVLLNTLLFLADP